MAVLEQILASKRAELPKLRARRLPAPPSEIPEVELRRQASMPLHLICEIKRKSPSAGVLSSRLSVEERARIYEQSGASMISVLCDQPFFDGAYEHLLEARRGCKLALLCKEFIIDDCQLDAARSFGASAVLLIVRCLDDAALARLVEGSVARGMLPLVEVFTELEAVRAQQAGATFIGVNARDLDTLEMNQERAERIVESFATTVTVAQLSGIRSADSVAQVAQGRADAALIGEVLMKQHDPGPILASMVLAARGRAPR